MKEMKRIIRAFLTNNPGFKLLAVALAFVLWLLVYNTEDPNITRTFTVSVDKQNEQAIADMNKCYTVVNNSDVVTFAATAARSIMDKLDENSFVLTADMDDLILSEDGKTGTVTISIGMRSPSYNSLVKINSKSKKMEVTLENLDSKQFIVTPEYEGIPKDGYALGTVSIMNPNVLKVSGRESVVERISKIVATIDVEDMAQDLVASVIPVLYDAEGREINISANGLTLSSDTVSISAKILGTKTVGITYSWSGTPAGENKVIGVESSTEAIVIKGYAAALNHVTNIEIPAAALNVSGATGDVSTVVDITEYLPDGIDLLNPEDAKVTLTARIETYGTKLLNISASSIQLHGLAEAYSAEIVDDSCQVIVAGSDANLRTLVSANAYVDVTGLEPGIYSLPLVLNLNESKYTYVSVHVQVKISDTAAEMAETSSNAAVTGSNQTDIE